MRVGILVGGRSSRMGSPKGLLLHRGQPLVTHLAAQARRHGHEVVLVGNSSAYADVLRDTPRMPDAPAGIGPIGGLSALLQTGSAIAVACDMPYVSNATWLRLGAPSGAAIVAPCSTEDGTPRWEPLLARYDASVLSLLRDYVDAGGRSLQGLIRQVGSVREVVPLAVPMPELRDWDRPEDLP